MMLYPSIMDLMKKAESRYSLVIAASKRAREISEETAQEEGSAKDGAKSITQAVGEIAKGDIEIIEGHDIEPDKRAILESTILDKMESMLEPEEEDEDEGESEEDETENDEE